MDLQQIEAFISSCDPTDLVTINDFISDRMEAMFSEAPAEEAPAPEEEAAPTEEEPAAPQLPASF